MTNIRERIFCLVNKVDIDGGLENFKLTSYMLCAKFGWDYYTLIKQPIPFILDMIDCIKIEADKINNEKTPENKKDLKVLGGKHG